MPNEPPRLVSWNNQAATLLGLDRALPLGTRIDELEVAPEIGQLLTEVLSRWHAGSTTEPWETVLSTSHRILENSMLSLGLSTSGANRVCVLTGDVTLRRMADQGVAQSRRLQALGEMVGGIAHEFNNLLTPVTATVDMMRRHIKSSEWSVDDLQVIEDAAGRAAELTRRLLSFGRKTEVTSRSVYIAELVSNCLALMRPACDRRIEWKSQIPSDLRALDFNPTDLNQILLNLIINARDALQEKLNHSDHDGWVPLIAICATEASPEMRNPRLEDAARGLQGWQILTVEDNGTGIPDSVKDRIFEPFFTTKDVGHGTGIGLATVWHLATDAGGTVEVESRVGEGTRFRVVLPRWQARTSIAPSMKKLPIDVGLPKMCVFLVEDDHLLARACMRGLIGLGHQVTRAADGLEAWQSFESGAGESHDVLLTDVNMPRMNGIDLVRRVRNAGFGGRVVVMSGRADTDSMSAIQALEVDYILAKPFTISQLMAAMATVAARANVREQRASTSSLAVVSVGGARGKPKS